MSVDPESTPTEEHGAAEDPRWLDRPGAVDKIIWALCILSAATVFAGYLKLTPIFQRIEVQTMSVHGIRVLRIVLLLFMVVMPAKNYMNQWRMYFRRFLSWILSLI